MAITAGVGTNNGEKRMLVTEFKSFTLLDVFVTYDLFILLGSKYKNCSWIDDIKKIVMLQFALYCNAFCWMWTYLDIVVHCTWCMISRTNASWSILLASIINYMSKFQLILEYRIYIVSIIEWSFSLISRAMLFVTSWNTHN